MKKLTFYAIALLLFGTMSTLNAQDKALDVTKDVKEITTKDRKEGWVRIGGIGADFSLLNLINPRSGAGDNRYGFGGLLNYGANLTKGKILWDNKFNFQLAAVKVGEDNWTKANDVVQATSQFGYKIINKWYAAGIADFQSQILATYGVNFLTEKPTGLARQPLGGKFLSPAMFRFGPGIIYTPTPKMKILYSPVGIKAVIVTSDSLKRKGVFFPFDAAKPNKSTDFQLGSQLRFDYADKFLNDRLIYSTTLDLYSNYLRSPENIDLEWYHSLDLVVAKGISINLKSDWFYDHDILVLRGGEVNNRGRAPFIRNALLLKYTGVF
jgi:Protein of unknown function (DUF3078)